MIYKGHDIRIEREHIRVTELKTGASWTEDTITEAKRTIDTMKAVRQAAAEHIAEVFKKEETEHED